MDSEKLERMLIEKIEQIQHRARQECQPWFDKLA
jgi:hypothetical protein